MNDYKIIYDAINSSNHPIASDEKQGEIKVGKNLTIDEDGVLNVSIPPYYDLGDVVFSGAVPSSAIRVPLTDEQLSDLLANDKLAVNLNIAIEDEYEGTPFDDSVELNGIYSFVSSDQTISIFNYAEGHYTNDLQGSGGYIHVGLSLDKTAGSSAFLFTVGII